MSGVAPSPSLFTAADLSRFKMDRLIRVANSIMPGETFSDPYLLGKIQAEEARLQHEMRVFFSPRQMVPDTISPEALAALPGNLPLVYEPGYDFTPELFNGDTWGLIELRERWIIAVQSIGFNYPLPTDTLYSVPVAWIRADRKYGNINLVPVSTNSIPLNAYLLSVLGGGSRVPLMMQVTYTCGLANARQDYPDLIDLIYKSAVLSIIEDDFLPASGSTSVDGLSQSLSYDAGKLREGLQKRQDALTRQLIGINFAICG